MTMNAQEAYNREIATLKESLEKLQARAAKWEALTIDDNWGCVGDLKEINARVNDVLEFVKEN